MLLPAQERDLPQICALIRDGAAHRSFDEELARDSVDSAVFFTRLRDVISRRIWVRPAAGAGLEWVPASLFVFHENAASPAIGFVAIRGAGPLGYELWLTALDRQRHGRGLGRRMLTEFFGSPEGSATSVAQCSLHAPGAQACAHILASAGFVVARTGKESAWLARAELPRDALEWIRTAPFSQRY